MKTSLDHLPPRKQRLLAALVDEIRAAVADVELVVLFGSHARGDWVEDPVGGYKPKSYDIDYLGKLAGRLAPELRGVFPTADPEDKRIFDLLEKAYIDARYSTKYAVAEEELRVMAERVTDLRGRVERVCRERIEGAA